MSNEQEERKRFLTNLEKVVFDPEAQRIVGVCYERGDGVEKNEKIAVLYYKLAADNGLAEAQNNLGICYAYDLGVEKDDKEALRLFHLAAKSGNLHALAWLPYMYANRSIKDINEARYYLSPTTFFRKQNVTDRNPAPDTNSNPNLNPGNP